MGTIIHTLQRGLLLLSMFTVPDTWESPWTFLHTPPWLLFVSSSLPSATAFWRPQTSPMTIPERFLFPKGFNSDLCLAYMVVSSLVQPIFPDPAILCLPT